MGRTRISRAAPPTGAANAVSQGIAFVKLTQGAANQLRVTVWQADSNTLSDSSFMISVFC
jgi:hypothetical protein